jgi:hypothetical protein
VMFSITVQIDIEFLLDSEQNGRLTFFRLDWAKRYLNLEAKLIFGLIVMLAILICTKYCFANFLFGLLMAIRLFLKNLFSSWLPHRNTWRTSIGIANRSKLPAQKRTGCLRGRRAARGRTAAFVRNRRVLLTHVLDWRHPGRCRNLR